jgi:hypothetical protein
VNKGDKFIVEGYKILVQGYKCRVQGYKILIQGYKFSVKIALYPSPSWDLLVSIDFICSFISYTLDWSPNDREAPVDLILLVWLFCKDEPKLILPFEEMMLVFILWTMIIFFMTSPSQGSFHYLYMLIFLIVSLFSQNVNTSTDMER